MDKIRCTVCENHVDEENAVTQEYEGNEYYLCSDECRIEFIKDPNKYLDYHHSVKESDSTEMLICAACGRSVPEEEATKQEYQEDEGPYEKYYFCSDECRIEFIKDPNKYTGQSGKHLLA